MSRFPTLVFLLLVTAALLVSAGCKQQEAEQIERPVSALPVVKKHTEKTKTVEASDVKNGPFRVKFEKVIQRPYVPSVAVKLSVVPDNSGFFILGRNGDLYYYPTPIEKLQKPKRKRSKGRGYEVQDIVKVKIEGTYAKGDMGSIGMALDPDYLTNHLFYVWYADRKDEYVNLDRFEWSKDPKSVIGSRTNIISVSRGKPEGPYHMGGVVEFLPDKTLLIAIGDAEQRKLSQDKTNLNGKLLRIIPNRGPEGGYTVPEDNPWFGKTDRAPEILATGLRAPFRAYLHQGQHLFFGDVGATHEEVDVWTQGNAVVDYGWGRKHHADGILKIEGAIDPLFTWTRKEEFCKEDDKYQGETRMSAGVGVVYDQNPNDRYEGLLTNKLIFFEVMRGWIRAAELGDANQFVDHQHIGHLQFIGDSVVGRDGYVYFLTWGGTPGLHKMVLSQKPGNN